MAENANLLSTPEGYATPDQIKSTYEYAKALMQGSGQQPVKHWTQGISNMVSALVGGDLDYQAGQKQKEADAVTAGRMLPAVPGGSGPLSPLGEAPLSGVKSAGGDASKAISGIESGGDYSSVGVVIPKTGDRAYGKYQVMGNNIPEWTQAVLGKSMTPAEFLKSPEAQEAVFKQKFGEYTQKYGPEGAAKAWFAGEAGMKNPNAHDPNGMTVANYAKKFTAAMGGPQGGATAFTGPDSQPPAVQAVTSALRGGEPAPQQLAASKGGSATPMPLPSGSGIFIDPSLVQRRPQYNEGQMRGILSDPKISEQAKLGLLQQYNQQGQPIDVPYPGGIVRIDPNNPTHQQFIPEGHWGEKSLPGGLKYPIFQTPSGRGTVDVAPQSNPAAGPRSDAAPASEPAAAPQGGPASAPAPVTATAPNAPEAAPAVAPEGTPAAPVQVASLDPAAGVAQAAAAQAASGAPGAAVPGAPEVKVAQVDSPTPLARALGPNSKPPPGYSPDDWEATTRWKQFENNADIDKDAQIKSVDAAAKKYDTLSVQAQAARKLGPNIDMALALTNDPRFHSGLLAGPQDLVSRVKESLFGDKNANAPNEVFDKLMAGTVLDTMKTALAGLGQVRLAEIGLLTKANANRANTAASNRAVLEISRRGLESIDHIDSMGQMYASGDEVADPISGKIILKANMDKNGEILPRHGLDVGFDKIARKFVLDHPTFTPEQIKRYETIFSTGLDPDVKAAEPTGTGPAIGTEKQFKQGTGVWDGKQWTPKAP